MAREQEEAPRGHRLIALGAVGLLSMATAVAFGRVFEGRVPTLKLVAAALASTALAALMERRSSLLAAVVSAAGLFVAIGLLVFPHSLSYGFPAGRTFRAIGRSIGHISHQAAVQVAPSPPVRPLMLAAVTAAWTAAFSTHALAIRSGSPLLAAIPSAALFTFAGIVVGDGPRPAYAVFFLIALFALLFSDSLRRVRQWGPLRPWGPFGRSRFASATTTRGARRVTVAAVGLAVLLPGLLPGFRSGSILDVGNRVGGGIAVDPLVSVTASLKNSHPVQLFTVRSDEATYWRWLSLDHFDGTSWSTDDLKVDDGTTVPSGLDVPSTRLDRLKVSPKDGFPVADVTTLTQEVTILNPPGEWLPAAYRPEAFSLPGAGALRYDPTMDAGVPRSGISSGFVYEVVSQVLNPTFQQLDRVRYDLSDRALQPYTQLPPETVRDMQPLATQITQGQTTPFRQVLAIQRFFRSGGFEYSTDVPGTHDTNFLVRFITRDRKGFCQQFATAMAVLVRALGYPARIAVGYTPGTFDPATHAYRVSTANAHSWVEVYFPGFGWLPFEPTPGPGNPPEPSYYNAPPTTAPDPGCDPRTAFQHNCSAKGTEEGNGQQNSQQDNNRPGSQLPPPGVVVGLPHFGPLPTPKPRSEPVSWRLMALLALALLVAAVAVFMPLVKVVWRRLRVRRAHTPRQVVLARYGLFTSQAADLGLGRGPGETLAEYEARLRHDVRFSDGHLGRLTTLTGRAAYSEQEVTKEDAREATRAARATIREVRREAPAYRRVLGWWRPTL